jgi:hypothetical protein
MPDYHQTIDQIRAFVQATDQTRSAALEGLASFYAEACAEVSQRLSRCHRLLQQGLRSEAIQLAEIEPKLLDAVATLDFPERAAWDELVAMYGLPEAPRFQVEVAAFLNEAYAQEDPLQDLLRTLRRLALVRGPLKERIDVMRKLAAQDPNNPVWTDDLRSFEKVRFRQIQADAVDASKRHNVDAIGLLLAELEQQTWTEAPPPALLQGIRKADAQFRGQRNRAILSDLEGQLCDAFAASDPVRGRLARDRWFAMLESVDLADTDPIHGRVAEALEWLEVQDRRDQADRDHEAATKALLRNLDDPKRIRPAELERLGNAVLGHPRGMLESVQRRYLDRLWKEHAAAQKRTRLIIAGSASAAVLVASLVFILVRGQARSNDAEQAATALADMLELGELEQASEFVRKLETADAGLLAYPPLVEARSRFDAAKEKDVERALKFDQALREAQAAPVTDPRPAALDTAKSLARMATEKAAIEQIEKARQSAYLENRDRLDKEMAPRLDAVSVKIARMRSILDAATPSAKGPAELPDLVVQAQQDLAAMSPQFPHLGNDLKSLSHALGEKLEAVRKEIAQREQRQRLEDEITESVAYSVDRDPVAIEAFIESLATYAKSFPNSPRSKAFALLEKERPAWQAVSKWARLTSAWRDEGEPVGTEKIKVRLDQAARFLAENPSFPDLERAELYRKHLESMSRRDSGAESPRRRLNQLFSDILVESIWMVRVREPKSRGKCYYMAKRPTEGNRILYLGGFDGRERAKAIITANIDYSDWSPQTKIAVKYRGILNGDGIVAGWDRAMTDMLGSIRSSPEMDPLLQVALLRKVLDLAMEGSEPLREALGPSKSLLDQADVDVNVPWMDPENSDADRLRPKAVEVVKSLPDFDEVRRGAQQHRQLIEKIVHRLTRPVGWLIREGRRCDVRVGKVLPPKGDLWVIVPGEGARTAWKQVGTIQNSRVKVLADSPEVMVEGRPVFRIEEAIPKS